MQYAICLDAGELLSWNIYLYAHMCLCDCVYACCACRRNFPILFPFFSVLARTNQRIILLLYKMHWMDDDGVRCSALARYKRKMQPKIDYQCSHMLFMSEIIHIVINIIIIHISVFIKCTCTLHTAPLSSSSSKII